MDLAIPTIATDKSSINIREQINNEIWLSFNLWSIIIYAINQEITNKLIHLIQFLVSNQVIVDVTITFNKMKSTPFLF